jgi:hypothetical protein
MHSTYGPCVIVCLNDLYVVYVSGVSLIDNSCNFVALVMKFGFTGMEKKSRDS